ncbi:MAG: 50S ribosomal protein L15 [Christensenellales bacterium]|jgi:large subunit ribosomal protein L15
MKIHEIAPAPGAVTLGRRLGRGIGSGLGKTSGKGHKGQKARSGGGTRPGFEGGQMPLYLRIPKRGFTNRFRTEYACVNVGDLNRFEAGTTVTPALLLATGLVKKVKAGVKILGNGEINRPLIVQAAKFSDTAKEKIEAAKGSIEVL